MDCIKTKQKNFVQEDISGFLAEDVGAKGAWTWYGLFKKKHD